MGPGANRIPRADTFTGGPDVDDSRPTSTVAPVTVGISAEGPCILWTRCLNPNGYGVRKVGGRTVLAHRHAWALVHGDPGKLCVLHRCDTPACINVDHLFLGTRADNIADMNAKGRQSRLGGNKGERQWRAKLTADLVREIRASTETGVVIARRLGVSRPTVSRIRLRKGWAHIPFTL